MMSDPALTPVIVAARRTALTRTGGALSRKRVEDLAAPVLAALVTELPAGAPGVSEVILGNAVAAGGNPARLAALAASLGVGLSALTVDRQCTSGLDAIHLAATSIRAGNEGVYLAGGAESISTAPQRLAWTPAPDGSVTYQPYARARFAPEGFADPEMGAAAEYVAVSCGISRLEQDELAFSSHERALAAMDSGAFDAELVTVPGAESAHDDGPRRSLKAPLLSRFPAAFEEGGTVTAGNSCHDADGAAGVLLMSVEAARRSGFTRGLVLESAASAGVDPSVLGLGAAEAFRRLGVQLDTGALVEFNQAFASQTIACLKAAGVEPPAANLQGGAIALGHAYGASGAVLMVRLFHQALARDVEGQQALAMISGAGGQGVASSWRWKHF